MTPLFAFVFQLSTVTGDPISCFVIAETFPKACEKVLALELPIIAQDADDLEDLLKEVYETDDEEENTPSK